MHFDEEDLILKNSKETENILFKYMQEIGLSSEDLAVDLVNNSGCIGEDPNFILDDYVNEG
jgi:hypothetical protein